MTSLTIEDRLAYHNYKNKSFTQQANDWEVIFTKDFKSKKEAVIFEKKIKKRGAKRFLEFNS